VFTDSEEPFRLWIGAEENQENWGATETK